MNMLQYTTYFLVYIYGSLCLWHTSVIQTLMALNDLFLYYFYGYSNISGYLLKSIFQIYFVRYMSLVYDASFQICACLHNLTKYDPSKPRIVGRGDHLSYVPCNRGSSLPMTADLKAEDHALLCNIKLNFLEVCPGKASVYKRYLSFRIARSEYKRMGPL
jgi:hypothetical protein